MCMFKNFRCVASGGVGSSRKVGTAMRSASPNVLICSASLALYKGCCPICHGRLMPARCDNCATEFRDRNGWLLWHDVSSLTNRGLWIVVLVCSCSAVGRAVYSFQVPGNGFARCVIGLARCRRNPPSFCSRVVARLGICARGLSRGGGRSHLDRAGASPALPPVPHALRLEP